MRSLSLLIFDGVDFRCGDAKVGLCSAILKALPAESKRILVLSSYPASTTEQLRDLVSLFSLDQIIARTLKDTDIAGYVGALQSLSVECTGTLS